jgi:hypothetical protein
MIAAVNRVEEVEAHVVICGYVALLMSAGGRLGWVEPDPRLIA